MNNGTFGKTMENLRKIFNKNLVNIHEITPVLTLDKAVYVGISILDLNKL